MAAAAAAEAVTPPRGSASYQMSPDLEELLMPAKKTKRWVKTVTTDSTHPPEGLFNKSAATIARSLASKKVSPKGPASGMRMLTYYINRAGHNLSVERRAELEKAKSLLSKRVAKHKESTKRSAAA
jgi:tRNA(adenine34) deaminase